MGTCGYCGNDGPVSDDHNPAESFFPKPRPANLIKVPACDGCHSDEWSRDDEYLRFHSVIHIGAGNNPAARRLYPVLIRSIANPNKQGWAGYVFRNVRDRDIHTPAGIYVGHHPTYPMDVRRLHRVAKRVLRGLYYTKFGNAVPATHSVHGFLWEYVRQKPHIHDNFREVIGVIQQAPTITLGERVFRYRMLPFPGDPCGILAAFDFYEAVAFVGWVALRDADEVADDPPPSET